MNIARKSCSGARKSVIKLLGLSHSFQELLVG